MSPVPFKHIHHPYHAQPWCRTCPGAQSATTPPGNTRSHQAPAATQPKWEWGILTQTQTPCTAFPGWDMQEAPCTCATSPACSAATHGALLPYSSGDFTHPGTSYQNVVYVKCWIIFQFQTPPKFCWTGYINRGLKQTKRTDQSIICRSFQLLKLMLHSKWSWINNNEITSKKKKDTSSTLCLIPNLSIL